MARPCASESWADLDMADSLLPLPPPPGHTAFGTLQGTLLAFAEGRKYGCGDFAGQHDVVMRRSTDAGSSWSELVVLLDPVQLFGSIQCPAASVRTEQVQAPHACRCPDPPLGPPWRVNTNNNFWGDGLPSLTPRTRPHLHCIPALLPPFIGCASLLLGDMYATGRRARAAIMRVLGSNARVRRSHRFDNM